MTMKIPANELREGDFLPGLDNGYVVEVEENDGYLSYPGRTGGYSVAMPEDTIVVTFHDAEGSENYLLLAPTCELEVSR